MKHILMLLNPRAGGGRAGKLLARMEQEFVQHGARLTVLTSEAPGSLRAQLAGDPLEGVDAVVAAGGDGTLFEALNGLMVHPGTARPPLGVVPVGTGNAFCRDLGLEGGEWKKAIALIMHWQVRSVDVGQVDGADGRHYFLNIAGMGFVVAAGATAARLKHFGKPAYTLAALWQVLRLPGQRLRIQADGQDIEQDSLFLEISNSRFTGTSFLMAPAARLDDGLLDLTLVRRLPRLRLLQLFHTIYSGEHVRYPEVTTLQASAIHIQQPAGCPMMMDGEMVGTTPAMVRCLPLELSLLG